MKVLITGATDGIGRALAEIYRGRGERLVLVGRRALDSFECGLYSDETYCEADLSEADRAGDRRAPIRRDNRLEKQFPEVLRALLRRRNRSPDAMAGEMKHAVITGAANGIGEALARRLVHAEYSVTGVDVDAKRAALMRPPRPSLMKLTSACW